MNTHPDPRTMSRRALQFYARHYHAMSEANTDRPRSNYHRYFYAVAAEMERRHISLTRTLKVHNHGK